MPSLVGKQIGSTGFGLMGLATRVPPISDQQAIGAMRAAIESGMTFWNGGDHYGTPERNSQTLLANYLRQYPEDADKIVLSVKGAYSVIAATGLILKRGHNLARVLRALDRGLRLVEA